MCDQNADQVAFSQKSNQDHIYRTSLLRFCTVHQHLMLIGYWSLVVNAIKQAPLDHSLTNCTPSHLFRAEKRNKHIRVSLVAFHGVAFTEGHVRCAT